MNLRSTQQNTATATPASKVEVSREKPSAMELGMTGKEDLDEELGEDDYFGFRCGC